MYGHSRAARGLGQRDGYSRAGREKSRGGQQGGQGERCVLSSLRDRQAFSGLRYYCHLISLVCSLVRKPRV